ncbi:hypothetical protein VTL71DRAFT_1411 [Oculimacula yallundae]|uniref:Uncharacterized protein n=1 Tax=Oculimacula yallundae TaxID=86028 RepID=A0ABR4CBE6_9HELO
MYWLLFTLARKTISFLSSKATGTSKSKSSPSTRPSPLIAPLQLAISFPAFIAIFLSLLFVPPLCSKTLSRLHALLTFSGYVFLFATLLALLLVALNPVASLSSKAGNYASLAATGGKWRSRLLRIGTLLCWIDILLGFLSIACILALQYTGSREVDVIALIGIGVLTFSVLIFAVVPELEPYHNDRYEELKSAEELLTREREEERKREKERKKAREWEWEDPMGSPTSPTRIQTERHAHAHMPLTPAPGDEKAIFAKEQAERLVRLKNQRCGSDIEKWKRYFVLGVWGVQSVCVVILVVLSVMEVVEGIVGKGDGCRVQKVEVVGCGGGCFGGGGGRKEGEADTVTSPLRETQLVTLTETARETRTLGDGSEFTSALSEGGAGAVRTVVVVTSTTTTIRS